jgi:hypothetical protein
VPASQLADELKILDGGGFLCEGVEGRDEENKRDKKHLFHGHTPTKQHYSY